MNALLNSIRDGFQSDSKLIFRMRQSLLQLSYLDAGL